MNIHYACKDLNNVGDYLGTYILEKLEYKPEWVSTNKPHVMLVGSILQDANDNSLVLGAGFGARDQRVKGNPKIHIVRGKITSKMLEKQGFKKTWLEGDPALVLPLLFKPSVSVTHDLGIIPHYIDKDVVEANLDHFKGRFKVLDIQAPVEQFITELCSCKRTISSSLHGIILSHAYGIPCLWTKFSDRIAGDDMKYYDYGLTHSPYIYQPEGKFEIPDETREPRPDLLDCVMSSCQKIVTLT